MKEVQKASIEILNLVNSYYENNNDDFITFNLFLKIYNII